MWSARSASTAAAAYLVLTLALTWPVARGLATDVPADFGDPLLNMWILAWSARHPAHFDAGIFHPHPLALAYSDHLTPQALAISPVLAATGNPILAYNVLYLSTFVLSALGMFLLVRELTGDRAAAFVAGMAFGFAPYRFSATPHVQVLSSMWMPFAVLGFRRFFKTGGRPALLAGALAWLAQNLSCGYYLFFFSPALAIYLAWEVFVGRVWADRRRFAALAAAVAAVFAATIPFLLPYAWIRQLGFEPRRVSEVQKYAADVYAWFTADPSLRVWGGIASGWRHAEGALFPGVTIAALAGVGIVLSWRAVDASPQSLADWDERGTPTRRWRERTARLSGALAILAAVASVCLLLGFAIRIPREHPLIRIAGFERSFVVTLVLAGIWFSGSEGVRRNAAGWLRSPVAPFTAMTLFSVVMSLGPAVYARGRLVTPFGLYRVFYDSVPGFDGLRVPARFAMVAAFGLAVLAGCGVAALGRRVRNRSARVIAVTAAVLIAAESFAVPLPIDQNDTTYGHTGLAPLPPHIGTGESAPPVYRFIAALPPESVILELPLGEPAFDARYMFYAIAHGRTLVNGYSGGAPAAYGLLSETLADILTRPDAAWTAVRGSGATEAIVHEAAYAGGRGPDVSGALRTGGAREIGVFGTDRIFRIQ